MSEEWTIVGRKNKRIPPKEARNRNNDKDPLNTKILGIKIETQKKLVIHSPICTKVLNLIPPTNNLVILGLGSIENNNSLIQFVLILLIKHKFNNIYFYDPIITKTEINFLQSFGFIFQNVQKVEELTVFYMIHCEHELYEQLVKNNNLKDLIIIGNSFTNNDNFTNIMFKEVVLADDKDLIFNNTCIITFA
jgi:hypothetical protein